MLSRGSEYLFLPNCTRSCYAYIFFHFFCLLSSNLAVGRIGECRCNNLGRCRKYHLPTFCRSMWAACHSDTHDHTRTLSPDLCERVLASGVCTDPPPLLLSFPSRFVSSCPPPGHKHRSDKFGVGCRFFASFARF